MRGYLVMGLSKVKIYSKKGVFFYIVFSFDYSLVFFDVNFFKRVGVGIIVFGR